MLIGQLELQMYADMSRLQKDMQDAQRITGSAMGDISKSIEQAKATINAMAEAEKARASLFDRTMSETKRLLDVAKAAANDTGKALGDMKINPDAMKVPKEVFDSLQTWQDKMAYAAGSATAVVASKAKEVWEWAKGYAEKTIVIAGVAWAMAWSAAWLSAGYAVYKSLSFIGGLLTGESYKSESIDILIKQSDELKAKQAELRTVMGNAGSAIRDNSDSLDAMGVAYEHANGKAMTTVETLKNAKVELDKYTEGEARSAAAAILGIGSYEEIQAALKGVAGESQKSRDRINEFNLGIGSESLVAVEAYKSAMTAFNDESKKTADGFSRAWADQIMPVLTDLANFFKDGFPAAVDLFRGTLALITSAFYGVKTVIFSILEVIFGAIQAIAIGIAGIALATINLFTGNFVQAKTEIANAWEAIKERVGTIGTNMSDRAVHDADAVKLAWAMDNRKDGLPMDAVTKGLSASTAAALVAAHSYNTGSIALTALQKDFVNINAAMDDMAAHGQKGTEQYLALEAALKAVGKQIGDVKPKAEASDKELLAMQALLKASQERIAVLKAQEVSLAPLTESEKAYAKLMTDSTHGYSKAALATRELVKVRDLEAIALEKIAAVRTADTDALQKYTQATQPNIEKLQEEASAQNLNAIALQQITAARAIEKAAFSVLYEVKKDALGVDITALKVSTEGAATIGLKVIADKAETASLIEKINAQKMSVQYEQEIAQLKIDGTIYFDAADKAVAMLEKENATRQKNISFLKEDSDERRKAINDYEQWYQLSQNKIGVDKFNTLWQSVDQTAHTTFTNIFQGGQDAFTKLRDTLKSTLLDLLYQMTVKKWIFNITAAVTGNSGSIAGAASGGGGGVMGAINTASSANSLYNMGSSAYTVGAQYVGGTMSAANAGGTLYANATGGGLDALLGTNGAYGTALGASTAATTSLIASNTALGVELGATAAESAAAASAASAAGAAGETSVLAGMGPYGWAALAVVAAWSFFGGDGPTSVVGGGVRGTLNSTGNADVQSYTNTHADGGWFRSDDNQTHMGSVGGPMQKYLDQQTARMTASAMIYAKAIGLSADAVAGFTQSIDVSLHGLDAVGQQKAIDAALAGFGNAMVKSAYGDSLAAVAKEGEAASATLARLAVSLVSVNALNTLLRQRLIAVSVSGADSASKLADLFQVMNADGSIATTGLAGLSAASSAYYNAFFSDAEKAADSTKHMTDALATVNLTLPTSKDAFREMAASLDLNTEAGRKAYATMLTLAPEFDAAAQAAAKLAKETADRLLTTFTAGGTLVPALELVDANLTNSVTVLGDFGGTVYSINKIMGDSSSGVLTFGDRVVALDAPLSHAQLSAAGLTDQINLLKDSAKIDFAGLSNALTNVNTDTFMAVLDGVFKNLGGRFKTLQASITAERVAVREAAIQIIAPDVMSKSQIASGIAAQQVALPSQAGLLAANTALKAADQVVSFHKLQLLVDQTTGSLKSLLDVTASAKIGSDAALAAVNTRISNADAAVAVYRSNSNGDSSALLNDGLAGGTGYTAWPTSGERNAGMAGRERYLAGLAIDPAKANAAASNNLYEFVKSQQDQVIAADQSRIASATTTQAAATATAKKALLDYNASIQQFAIDAATATQKLTKLREETVKYYEQQKALADLMGKSASGLRQTVADYQYSQLDQGAQFKQLQGQFATAYSMALSTQNGVQAGYADKMNALLNPLLQLADQTGNSSLIASYLAQSQAVATALEASAPKDYQAESLGFLNTIDNTLAALDGGTKLMLTAIGAGSDQTANGLRSVIAAILHPANVPAFALGGYHAGGARIVGENGPEIEFTGPSFIANASQTRGMFSGGGNSELVAEVRALRQEVAALRGENRAGHAATAGNTGKLAKLADREYIEGKLVRTDASQPLATVVAV